MEYREKLIDLLKSDKLIKGEYDDIRSDNSELINDVMYLYDRITETTSNADAEELKRKRNNIINHLEKNKISQRFLSMYCLNNGFDIDFYGNIISIGDGHSDRKILRMFDSLIDFDEQTDYVREKIFLSLTKFIHD